MHEVCDMEVYTYVAFAFPHHCSVNKSSLVSAPSHYGLLKSCRILIVYDDNLLKETAVEYEQ